MLSRTHAFDRMDALERRYDGPIPPADPAFPPGPPPAARARLFERMAAEAARAAAKRRRTLAAPQASGDHRLGCLAGSLAYYRNEGLRSFSPRPPAGEGGEASPSRVRAASA